MFFAVLSGIPLCILPVKDTIEELFWKEKGLSKKINVLITLALVVICYLLSILIDDIGDAITLTGATINPVVGYIIPILFYWKVREDLPLKSKEKIFCLFTIIVITAASIMSLGEYINLKVNGHGTH